MQKVTPVPSCLADSLEPAPLSAQPLVGTIVANEGYRRVRCSAAMIGLAISMSAASILVPNQSKPALATGAVSSDLTLANQNNQEQLNKSPIVEENSQKSEKLTPPAIKHRVKQGESIWQLSEEYKVDPYAIAASNNIAPQSDLLVGQTLKIPSVEQNQTVTTNQPETTAPRSNNSEQLEISLENLRETRKSLKESLGVLRSPKSTLQSKTKVIVTEVAQVSNSQDGTVETQSKVVALSDGEQPAQIQEIPVEMPQSESNSQASVAVQLHNDSKLNLATPQPVLTEPSQNSASTGNEKAQLPVPIAITPGNSAFSQPSPEKSDPLAVSKVETNNSNTPIPLEVIPAQTPTNRELDDPTTTTGFSPLNVNQPSRGQTTSDKVYRVQPGDTLNSIARRHGIAAGQLAKANGISNPNLIKVNQPLVIPIRSVAQKRFKTNSTVITGIPLAINQTNSQLPQAMDPMGTLPSESVVSSVSTNTPNQNNRDLDQINGNLSIPVEVATETHREKLRADITGLQQQYKNSQPIPIAVEPVKSFNSSTSVDQQPRNNEWDNDWRSRKGQNESSLSRFPSSEQIIGAAPINPGEYNNNIQIPVGESVSPDLPGISPPNFPDMPNTPTRFNGYIWPAKGVLTSGYGWRWGRMHRGVDIAAPVGTPVYAAAPGEVISAGWNSGGYGNLVKLKHADGSVTYYAHNSRLLVRTGQVVEQGQQISEMGSTGFSTGPHLHFEVHPGGQGAVNPIAYLPRRGK